MLLLVAMAGVIYGWQPDDRGGVEYIIQIPPDQLREIEQLGEISSLIDPAVQGHVSRVVIRVGTAPVPQLTPQGLTRGASSRPADGPIAMADHTPVPIPQMSRSRETIPIPSVDGPLYGLTTRESEFGSESVMKPDPEESGGSPGFSLPPTLRNMATDAINNDSGGLNPLNGNLSRPATAADSARRLQASSTSTGQPPPFTGDDPSGALARQRTNGPSTDPTNSLDNSWYDLSRARQSGPSTDPVNQAVDPRAAVAVGPADPRATASGVQNPRDLGFGAATQNNSAAGLGTTSTFGRLPGGMSLPNSDRGLSNDQLAAQRAGSGTATNFGAGQGPIATNGNGYGQSTPTQQSGSNDYNNNPNSYADSLNRNPYPQARNDASQLAYGTSFGTVNVNGQSSNTPQSGTLASRTQLSPVDPNLTTAQASALPAGAWTVDAYGRPVDRDGRLLDQFGRPINSADMMQSPLASDARARQSDLPRSSLGQPNLSQPSNLDRGYPTSDIRNQYTGYESSPLRDARVTAVYPGASTIPIQERTSNTTAAVNSPPSLSDRPMSGSRSGIDPPTRQAVTAQPLFNGLLLISFVANVYLVFWLKNLRHQFRDLVMAKRMAGSGTPAG